MIKAGEGRFFCLFVLIIVQIFHLHKHQPSSILIFNWSESDLDFYVFSLLHFDSLENVQLAVEDFSQSQVNVYF